MTPLFGRVKGEAEASLLQLSKESPALKIYSVRPGGVDATNDKDIQPYLPNRKLIGRLAEGIFLPPIRAFYTSMHSPTALLGRVFIDLATSDGEPLEGKGISGEGRTLNNVALRRLAGL